MKTALLVGATGLTGNLLLQLLLANNDYEKVTVYTRRTLGINHAKLEEKIIDFDTLNEAVQAEDVFCCLGTTIKKAGSKPAFEKVDYEYPLRIAKLQQQVGSKNFLVISAMGADASSMIFYSRVKGKLENELQQLGYRSLYILRPSLIVGDRKEKRTGEKIGMILSAIINPILIGPLKKYKSVSAMAIAKAMMHFAS
ncbi:MAG: oxidoreductase, partial [Chitinophagaceae bacterium]|nr:oxidoreductase [Chitinophagaceae bacterium]